MDSELLKQMGVFAFALVALAVLWKFGKMMLLKFVSMMESQIANAREDAMRESQRCHDEFAKQSETFAKALDKRDSQMDEVVLHLHEQTTTMKVIAETTGRIDARTVLINVNPNQPK